MSVSFLRCLETGLYVTTLQPFTFVDTFVVCRMKTFLSLLVACAGLWGILSSNSFDITSVVLL